MKIVLLIILLSVSTPGLGGMDKSRCGAAIVAALKTLNPMIAGPAEANLLPYWVAVCDEIIKEIQVNMDVTTTVTVPGAMIGPNTLVGTGTDTSIQ